MKVTVKGYFHLQKAIGGSNSLEVEGEIRNVRDLLDTLFERYGEELRDLIFEPGSDDLSGHLMLLVNGRNVLSMPSKLDTVLEDGDEVALFPPIGGG